MILEQLLHNTRDMLSERGIDDASFESEVLLRHTLKLSRAQLYVEFNREVSHDECENYRCAIARRSTGEPTAYIIGYREFFGHDFQVDNRVLIPRPETELLVEHAIKIARNNDVSIADVGTGSGVIAISLAVSLPRANIYAIDISQDALDVAHSNCLIYGVENRVNLLVGDLLEPLTEPVDIIVANLPYIKKHALSNVNTYGFEPSIALDGGVDGLDKIRRLCTQIPGKLNPGGTVLLEIGYDQSYAVTSLLKRCFPYANTKVSRDLAGLTRMVTLTIPE